MRWAQENAFDSAVNLSSVRWNVPVPLLKAVIAVESGFNPLAYSGSDPGGAWGLMQMLPATARALGYAGEMGALLTDPGKAIDLGAQLLSQNLGRAEGVMADSVSAYNGGFRPSLGFGTVLASTGSYGNQAYVNRVLDAYAYFAGPSVGGAVPAEAGSFRAGRYPRTHALGSVPSSGLLTRLRAWWRRWTLGG